MKMENDVSKHKINEFSSSTLRTRGEPTTYGYLQVLHSTALPPDDTIIQSISNLNESKYIVIAFNTDSVQIGVDN